MNSSAVDKDYTKNKSVVSEQVLVDINILADRTEEYSGGNELSPVDLKLPIENPENHLQTDVNDIPFRYSL